MSIQKNHQGFTLIELVIVIVLLGILAAVAAPKFINLRTDAIQANMHAMKGAIESAKAIATAKILVRPDQLNTAQASYTLSNGENIRVRGKLPDGRWQNTFAELVDFENIAAIDAESDSDNCLEINNDGRQWCAVQHTGVWFSTRGYDVLGTGRGFLIFPIGYNHENQRCYIYYINQNDEAIPATVQPSIVSSDFSEC